MKPLAMLLCLCVSACASRSDRVLDQAQRGLAYDATYFPTPGGNPETLTFLEQRAAWLGVSVEYRPGDHEELRGAMGLSYRQGHGRFILVSSALSINGRIEVLAHELGHSFQPNLDTRGQYQVFAELVSVGVCQRLGVDSTRAAARYLQAEKSALAVAQTHRREIAFVVDLLTRGYR